MTDFQGTVSIVTGAARGIGRAVAAHLHAAGGQVVAVDIDAAGSEPPWRGRRLVGDVTDPSVQEACLTAAGELPGDLAVLVNCAFAEERAPLLDGTPEGWDRTFAVSLTAPVELSRRFVAALDSRPGAIVNVASVHAFRGAATFGAYAAAKAALVAFTRNAAVEWGPLGVRVNAVAPGFVDTEWTQRWPQARKQASIERTLLKRACTPQDIAAAIVFLCADTSMVTAQTLVVDGGYSL